MIDEQTRNRILKYSQPGYTENPQIVPEDARAINARIVAAYKPSESTQTPFQLERLENWERGC